MVLIVIMYALFASSLSMGKVLVTHTSPILLTGIRMSTAGIILLMYQYFSPREQFIFTKKHLFEYAQIIFFGNYLTYLLRFWGLLSMPSYKAAFLHNIAPFTTALYSYIIFKERISLRQLLGLCIGFLGITPILLTSTTQEQLTGTWVFISWQELAIIASVFTSSYSWVLVRKMIHKQNYAPAMINGICMTMGGVLAFATSLFMKDTWYIREPRSFALLLVAVIFISNIFCHNLYGYLLKKYTATLLSFASFLTPLFAALYGWAFLDETITWHFYVSTVIVFTGLFIFYQNELKNRKLTLLVE